MLFSDQTGNQSAARRLIEGSHRAGKKCDQIDVPDSHQATACEQAKKKGQDHGTALGNDEQLTAAHPVGQDSACQ